MIRSNAQCVFEFDGKDADDSEWFRCHTHDALTLGDSFPCEGWRNDPADPGTVWPTTRVPVPTEAPGMTYSLNQLLDRCDRCGAQAFVVTVHVSREGVEVQLLWCGHHYREHESVLVEAKVLDLRSTINREASISATPS